MAICNMGNGHCRTTPFKLAFGTEVVILVEVSLSSLRREHFDGKTNDESRKLDVDFLDEVRDEALRRMTRYNKKMMRVVGYKAKSFLLFALRSNLWK